MTDDETQVEETEETEEQEEQEEAALAPDSQLEALKAEIAALKAQKPAPAPAAPGTVEMIPETNIVKPDGYDIWGIDKQIAFIAGTIAQGTTQMNMAVSRNARKIEDKADEWFKPYVQTVIENTDPRYLAGDMTEEAVEYVLELAMGKALKDGKTPTAASKPVPGASPVGTRPVPKTALASEVDEVLNGVRSAGYDKIADAPSIRKILEKTS